MSKEKQMVSKKTWAEFRDTKLLWWVNRSLHIFGWAICMEVDDDSNIIGAFPARVKFRGFSEDIEERNFITLSEYKRDNADEFVKEAKDED